MKAERVKQLADVLQSPLGIRIADLFLMLDARDFRRTAVIVQKGKDPIPEDAVLVLIMRHDDEGTLWTLTASEARDLAASIHFALAQASS